MSGTETDGPSATATTQTPADEQATTNERGGDAPKVETYCPRCDSVFKATLKTCPKDGTALVKFGGGKDPLVGTVIKGNFTLRRRLGAGGMGAVYVALQHSVGREVAIKVIGDRISRNWASAKRFLREAQLASRLAHPHIVTIHDFGQTEDELLYIVMEHLTGETLGDVIKREGALAPERVIDMADQLCKALETSHGMSIVHRDLKPSNIMLVEQVGGGDFIKVLDFGIAKSLSDDTSTTLTHSGQILGTPAYMAPEASLEGAANVRTDLYSLGVVLYHALAGTLPFVAQDLRMMIAQHASDEPPEMPDHVPASLRALVAKLMQKDPAQRYGSATEVRDALAAAGDDLVTVSAPTEPRERPSDMTPVTRASTTLDTRGRRPMWLGLAVLLVVGVGATLFALRGGGGEDRAATATDAAVDPPAVFDAGVVVATKPQAPADARPAVDENADAQAEPSAQPDPVKPDPRTKPNPRTPKPDRTHRAPIRHVVKIGSKPSGATIFINGVAKGKTSKRLLLRKRSFPLRIRLELKNHRPWTKIYDKPGDIVISPQLKTRFIPLEGGSP